MLRPIAWNVCSALALVGCSVLPTQKSAETWQVHPAFAVEHGISKAEQMYRIGRTLHGQGRYEEALAAYRQSIAQDQLHADAHNGIGVVLAEQGRYDEAIAEFRAAIALNPFAPHLHNNLGYAWHLSGRDDEAVGALEQALRLEPGNDFALYNLRLVRPLARARQATPSTAAEAAPPIEPRPAAVEMQAVVVEPNLEVAAVAPGIYELVPRGEPAAPAAASAPRTEAPAPQHKPYKLEVSNGNGVNGMARRVAEFLERQGIATGRLTNAATFSEARTYVEYRAGYRAEAVTLAETLPREAAAIESQALRADIHLRIVLGQDVRNDVALFETPRQQAGLATDLQPAAAH